MIDKFFNRLGTNSSYLFRKPKVSGYPREIILGITNKCNLECIMCPRGSSPRQEGTMDMQLFKMIIDQSKGLSELVDLSLDGEPLLHPDLIEMVRYCKKNGLKTYLQTNASLLNKDISKDLLHCGLDLLTISLDAATNHTYQKIKKKDVFALVLRNVKDFLELKVKNGVGPFVSLQFVYMAVNKKETEQFIKMWAGVKGVNAARIKTFCNFAGNVDSRLDGLVGPERKKYHPCYRIWNGLAIYWDGTIVPCCSDINAGLPLGNVREKSIRDIWNSDLLLDMRKKHIRSKHNELKICRTCKVPEVSRLAAVVSIFLDCATSFKLLSKTETFFTQRLRKGLYIH